MYCTGNNKNVHNGEKVHFSCILQMYSGYLGRFYKKHGIFLIHFFICRLLDPGTDAEIASYKIHRILFCVRGPTESDQKQCFAFTCSVGDSPDNAKFQCHVFRCDMIEAVSLKFHCIYQM